MQILCHRKDRKVGKENKMLGRGVGRILSWVGEYTPLPECLPIPNPLKKGYFIGECYHNMNKLLQPI